MMWVDFVVKKREMDRMVAEKGLARQNWWCRVQVLGYELWCDMIIETTTPILNFNLASIVWAFSRPTLPRRNQYKKCEEDLHFFSEENLLFCCRQKIIVAKCTCSSPWCWISRGLYSYYVPICECLRMCSPDGDVSFRANGSVRIRLLLCRGQQ